MSDEKINKYLAIKRRVEQAQQNVDRAKGALEQLIIQLKDEFDCSSLEEAEKKLKSLQKQEKTTKEEFEKAVDEFEKKWPTNESD